MKIFKARQMYLLFIVILSVFSITGCGGGGSDGQAPVLGSGDAVIAPTVTAVAPLNLATGVPINTKLITAAFSKAMAPASLTTASFTLAHGGTAVTGGTVTYVTTGNVATLTLPAGDLLSGTLYTATITTAATDTAGTPLASNYVWTFTTGGTADTAAPFITATGAYGATGVTAGAVGLPTNRVATATFNESMNPLTITTPPSFTVQNTDLAVPVAGTVTYSVAGKTATFTPTGGTFAASTLFTSTISVASTDLAGNAMAAPYVWSWSTGAGLDSTAPTVTTTNPLNAATGVCENKTVSATFSEEIDQATLTNLTFTVSGKTGLITYDALTDIASFNPDTDFAPGVYTATIKGGASGVKDLAGNALAVDKVWSFTTDTSICAAPVDLASASTFAIAATTGMTTAGGLSFPVINGDVTLHATSTCNGVPVPADGSIGPCGGSPPTVSGTVYSSFYLPAVAIAAKGDLRDAYLAISPAALPGGTSIAAGTTLGEPTGAALVEGDNLFYPGVYTSATSILITGDLTLDAQGDANAVFVFQSSSTVGSAVGARILLTGGAKASNVWWQAGSAATLETNTIWNGNILAYDNVTMNAGATSCGRLFAGASTDGFLALLINTVISVPGNNPAAPLCQ
jgi:hypothetical protein